MMFWEAQGNALVSLERAHPVVMPNASSLVCGFFPLAYLVLCLTSYRSIPHCRHQLLRRLPLNRYLPRSWPRPLYAKLLHPLLHQQKRYHCEGRRRD